MRIILTGAHGVGKTSVIERLTGEDFFSSFVTVPSARSKIAHLPHSKNTTEYTQSVYMQYYLDLPHNNYILDRCPLDVAAYTKASVDMGTISENFLSRQVTQVINFINSDDNMIFYIPIEFKPVDDGFRSREIGYQILVDESIRWILKGRKFTTLRGSVDERCDIVLKEFIKITL